MTCDAPGQEIIAGDTCFPLKYYMKKLFLIAGIAICGIYLINPTAGIIEMLPDNIPFIGNLDEAGATAFIIYAWRALKGDQGTA